MSRMWTKVGEAETSLYAVIAAISKLEFAIHATPSGETRNILTDANISLTLAVEQIRKAHAALIEIERKNRERRIP